MDGVEIRDLNSQLSQLSVLSGHYMIEEEDEIKEVRTLLKKGNKYFAKNDFVSSLKNFNAGLEIDEENPDLLAARCVTYLNLSEIEKADADAQKLVNLYPRNSQCLLLKSLVLKNQNQMEESLKVLLQSFTHAPKLTLKIVQELERTVQQILGTTIPDFQSLAENGNSLEILLMERSFQIGRIFFIHQKFYLCFQFLKILTKFLDFRSDLKARTLFLIASSSLGIGNPTQKTLELFQECLEFVSKTKDHSIRTRCLLELAKFHLKNSEIHQSIFYFEKLVESEKNSEIGTLQDNRNNLWSMSLKRYLRLNLQVLYKRIGNLDRSYAYAQQYISLLENPETTPRLEAKKFYVLGDVLESLGKYNKACENYEEYLKISEKNGFRTLVSDAFGRLGRINGKLRNWEEAFSYHSLNLGSLSRSDMKKILKAKKQQAETLFLKEDYAAAIRVYERVYMTETDAYRCCEVGLRLFECYLKTEKQEAALAILTKTLKKSRAEGLESITILCEYNFGNFYLSFGNKDSLELAELYFKRVIHYLQGSIQDRLEDGTVCPTWYWSDLVGCYKGIQVILAKQERTDECLCYAERLQEILGVFHRKGPEGSFLFLWGDERSQSLGLDPTCSSLEGIFSVVDRQDAMICWYSLLGEYLLTWVLEPGKGIVETIVQKRTEPAIREQMKENLENLLQITDNEIPILFYEGRSIPPRPDETLKSQIPRPNSKNFQIPNSSNSQNSKNIPSKCFSQGFLYEVLISPIEPVLNKLRSKVPKLVFIASDVLHFCPFASLKNKNGIFLAEQFSVSSVQSVSQLARILENSKNGKLSLRKEELLENPLELKQVDSSKSLKNQNFSSDPQILKKQNFSSDPQILKKQNFSSDPKILKKQNFYSDPKILKEQNFNSDPKILKKQNFNSDPKILKRQNFNSDPKILKKQNFNSDPKILKRQNFNSDPKILKRQNFNSDPKILKKQNFNSDPKILKEQNFNSDPQIPKKPNLNSTPRNSLQIFPDAKTVSNPIVLKLMKHQCTNCPKKDSGASPSSIFPSQCFVPQLKCQLLTLSTNQSIKEPFSSKTSNSKNNITVFVNPRIPDKCELYDEPWKPSVKSLGVAELEGRETASNRDVFAVQGEEATKENLLELIQNSSVLHLATWANRQEGFLACGASTLPAHPDKPPLAERSSYLVTSQEISKLQLNLKLVVFSCGQESIWKGPEGQPASHYLANAFLQAGTQSLLMCLKPIPDIIQRKFFKEFYNQLQNGNWVSQALWKSQRLIASKTQKRFHNVSFWCPFVLLGVDSYLNLQQISQAMMNDIITRTEKSAESMEGKNLLKPENVFGKVPSPEENLKTLQELLRKFLNQYSFREDLIQNLVQLIVNCPGQQSPPTAVKEAFHPIGLPMEISQNSVCMEILEFLGFQFVAQGVGEEDLYAVLPPFPYEGAEDFIPQVCLALSLIRDFSSNYDLIRAWYSLLPMEQETVSALIELFQISRCFLGLHLRMTNAVVAFLWKNLETKRLLKVIGYQQIGKILHFKDFLENRNSLNSSLQFLICVSYSNKNRKFFNSFKELKNSKIPESKANCDGIPLKSLGIVELPGKLLTFQMPWMLGEENEMKEKIVLIEKHQELKEFYRTKIKKGREMFQTIFDFQAPNILNKSWKPLKKVKHVPGSCHSLEKIPSSTSSDATNLERAERTRKHALPIIERWCKKMNAHYRNDLFNIYLPYVAQGHGEHPEQHI